MVMVAVSITDTRSSAISAPGSPTAPPPPWSSPVVILAMRLLSLVPKIASESSSGSITAEVGRGRAAASVAPGEKADHPSSSTEKRNENESSR